MVKHDMGGEEKGQDSRFNSANRDSMIKNVNYGREG